MRHLILVKHAKPEIVEGVDSHQWPLSPEGRQRCAPLAEAIRPYSPAAIYTSTEPKAIETGSLVAGALGLPARAEAGLEEHDRSNVPVMQTRDFISAVAHFFQNPDRLVLGRETGEAALARFTAAVDRLVADQTGSIVIVTHGTVLALYLAAVARVDPFTWWRKLGLPSFVVLSLPEYQWIAQVEKIA